LGGGDYHRLAVGVGRPVLAQGVVDHVLGVFSQEDRLAVDIALDRSAHLANSFWRKGWEPLTHALNQRDHDTA
jgi:peptidyl-tRNA hydrolase